MKKIYEFKKYLALMAAVAAFGAKAGLPMPVSCDVTDGIDLSFPRHALSIPAEERSKASQYVDHLREANYCPLGVIVIVGRAGPDEGSEASALNISRARAEYVEELFQRRGIPKEFIHAEGQGLKNYSNSMMFKKDKRSVVEIYVGAGCPAKDCMFPITESGLRLKK